MPIDYPHIMTSLSTLVPSLFYFVNGDTPERYLREVGERGGCAIGSSLLVYGKVIGLWGMRVDSVRRIEAYAPEVDRS